LYVWITAEEAFRSICFADFYGLFLGGAEGRSFIRRSWAKGEFALGRSAKRPNRGSLLEMQRASFLIAISWSRRWPWNSGLATVTGNFLDCGPELTLLRRSVSRVPWNRPRHWGLALGGATGLFYSRIRKSGSAGSCDNLPNWAPLMRPVRLMY